MASADTFGLVGIDDVLNVLENIYSLDGVVNHDEFVILCPVHDDSHPSCGINLTTGYWNCWSCSGRGDIVDLGVVLLTDVPFAAKTKKNRKPWMQARTHVTRLLKKDEPDAIRAALQRRLEGHRTAVKRQAGAMHRSKLPVPSEGSYEDGPLDYLIDRGFRKKVLRQFGIRFAPTVSLEKEEGEFFTLRNAIAIPIFNELGSEVICWCYRATDESQSWFQDIRYVYTPQAKDVLSENWFGMHQAVKAGREDVTINEGALDAMWNVQNGFSAIAALGSNVKQEIKVRKLMHFRHVTLMLDKDRAGVLLTHSIGEALTERGVPSSVCRWAPWMTNRRGKPAKDAQDLAPVDLELVHARTIPYLAWKHKNRLRDLGH